ncbi:unnamed protein product, partial [Adineta ricciae]
MDQKES